MMVVKLKQMKPTNKKSLFNILVIDFKKGKNRKHYLMKNKKDTRIVKKVKFKKHFASITLF